MDINTNAPYGCDQINGARHVKRIIAPNPSPFTFTGTATYVVGGKDVAIIDPGPALEDHFQNLMMAIGERHVRAILVTHTHKDHSPLASRLKSATGEPIMGCSPFSARHSVVTHNKGLDTAHDLTYNPDDVLADGMVVTGADWALEAITTPGHTANHLCFALKNENILFSADHVMAWSTSVIAPPDGHMASYLASLDRLIDRSETLYLPGHGGAQRDGRRWTQHIKGHRLHRERALINALKSEHLPQTLAPLVRRLYPNLKAPLIPAAEFTLLAHLEKLIEEGLVVLDMENEGAEKRFHMK